VWNAILLTGGYCLGNNWQQIGLYLSTYSEAVTGVLVVVALVFLGRYIGRKNRRKKTA
jgi:membrane protein DedA with SNARE-associated domain